MEVVHSATGAAVQVGTRGSTESKRCARLGVCLSGEGTPAPPCNNSFSALLKYSYKGSCLWKTLSFPAEGYNSTSAVLASLF